MMAGLPKVSRIEPFKHRVELDPKARATPGSTVYTTHTTRAGAAPT